MDNLAKIRAKLSGCIEGAGYNKAACGLYGLLTANSKTAVVYMFLFPFIFSFVEPLVALRPPSIDM